MSTEITRTGLHFAHQIETGILCCIIPYLIKDINTLKSIQRRAATFVIQDHSRFTSISSLLKDLNWAPLKDRRRDIRLAMLFKIVKCHMPVQADDILLLADPRTRHHHGFKFKHIQSQCKHSFFVRTVPEWNWVTSSWSLRQCGYHHRIPAGAALP